MEKGFTDVFNEYPSNNETREELNAFTTPPFSLPLSNIAILCDYLYYGRKEAFSGFLKEEYGTHPQTIEEQLTTNNQDDIISDHHSNIMSFEAPVVIFVCTRSALSIDGHAFYTTGTRARVSLTIIDANDLSPPFVQKHVDVVHWKSLHP